MRSFVPTSAHEAEGKEVRQNVGMSRRGKRGLPERIGLGMNPPRVASGWKILRRGNTDYGGLVTYGSEVMRTWSGLSSGCRVYYRLGRSRDKLTWAVCWVDVTLTETEDCKPWKAVIH